MHDQWTNFYICNYKIHDIFWCHQIVSQVYSMSWYKLFQCPVKYFLISVISWASSIKNIKNSNHKEWFLMKSFLNFFHIVFIFITKHLLYLSIHILNFLHKFWKKMSLYGKMLYVSFDRNLRDFFTHITEWNNTETFALIGWLI